VRTKNYIRIGEEMPRAMHEAWRWVCAVDAWDYCHPQPLADMVKSGPVPEELRPIIAAIVNGERKPNRKAAAKLKIPAEERMEIAGGISVVLGLIEAIKFQGVQEPYSGKGAVMLGDRDAREPCEVLRELEGEARKMIEDSAKELDVSIETVENLLRDLRSKMKHYPDI